MRGILAWLSSGVYIYIYINKQFNAHKVFVLLLRENEKL
jgi:hypothetical protein